MHQWSSPFHPVCCSFNELGGIVLRNGDMLVGEGVFVVRRIACLGATLRAVGDWAVAPDAALLPTTPPFLLQWGHGCLSFREARSRFCLRPC